ncbi:hypothetical protein B296_00059076 [Ensete ventricosum]|uniref:Uncharacterized protein n=1 Tax=Ensete ventricosum TaxID=4639 RepID=A0A426XJ77_ENSVE|nr:hypothetical protein B296_00059076 [Ensete ventricosum]
MMIDFDDDVSLVEKLVQYVVGIVELVEQKLLRHEIGTTEEIEQKLLLDSERENRGTRLGERWAKIATTVGFMIDERESDCCRVWQNAVGGWSLEDSVESAVMQRRRGAGGVALLVLQEGNVGASAKVTRPVGWKVATWGLTNGRGAVAAKKQRETVAASSLLGGRAEHRETIGNGPYRCSRQRDSGSVLAAMVPVES